MITFIFGISITNIKAQSVGINFNGSAPNTSVAFDVVINGLAGQKKGMLIPRIIQTQLLSMDALAVIAKGVYKTDGL